MEDDKSFKGMPPIVGQVAGMLAGGVIGWKAVDGALGPIEPTVYASEADAEASYAAFLSDAPSHIPQTEGYSNDLNSLAHIGIATSAAVAAAVLGRNNANKGYLIALGAVGAHYLHESYLSSNEALHAKLEGIQTQLENAQAGLDGLSSDAGVQHAEIHANDSGSQSHSASDTSILDVPFAHG